ncbi:MAG TPA: TatD family hydrolase [Polyangia bacterium]
MFDSHCHLDLAPFDRDRDEVLRRAQNADLAGLLVPAVRPSTFAGVEALRSDVASPLAIFIALGVHPQVVADLTPAELAIATDPEALAAAATRAGAVAIGECGLDGGTPDPARQEVVLRAHIRAARAAKLPVVLHILRAHGAAPRILREERVGDVGGVMHSYSGGTELIGVYRDLGLAFSLAGPVTFPGSRRPWEAAKAIPGDLLLAETDSPDQTPHPHRGKRNEPAFLREIIGALAEARGETADAMGALTARNACRLFRLPEPARASP